MDFFKEPMEIGMAPPTSIFEDVYIYTQNYIKRK